jgi:hypothetical protein
MSQASGFTPLQAVTAQSNNATSSPSATADATFLQAQNTAQAACNALNLTVYFPNGQINGARTLAVNAQLAGIFVNITQAVIATNGLTLTNWNTQQIDFSATLTARQAFVATNPQ